MQKGHSGKTQRTGKSTFSTYLLLGQMTAVFFQLFIHKQQTAVISKQALINTQSTSCLAPIGTELVTSW